jgi:hypothetical protein
VTIVIAAPLRVRAYFQEGWEGDFDLRFYKSLPNAEFETVDAETGRPTIPIPGPGTMGTIILAVLSSTVLADTIKTTLKKEPTRINQNRDLHTKRQREEAVDLRRPQY